MLLRAAMEKRYRDFLGRTNPLREPVIKEAQSFLDNELGDANALQRLCSEDDSNYWQQLSEVLLGYQLGAVGIAFSHGATGPDFCIKHEGRNIWVEVITPTAANVPERWTAAVSGEARDFPHNEILLRWTSAIKEKAEVLLGGPKKEGYLKKKIVASDDCYVIAINGRLLRGFGGAFSELHGISEFPFAVEATLGLGPLQISFDRNTLEGSEPKHQQRFSIRKPKGEPVPADTFLDPAYSPISAIWATDIDESSLIGRHAAMLVVHNPLAVNRLPVGFLPAQDEYVTNAVDEESYQLGRVDGRNSVKDSEA